MRRRRILLLGILLLALIALVGAIAFIMHPESVHDHSEPEGYWTCPMHPQVRSDEPGACPICGMPLVHQDASPAQVETVAVSDTMQRMIGISTTVVGRRGGGRTIRTVGRVEVNEQKIAYVQTKVQGWIEDLSIDFAGQRVTAGQPLLRMYSPELLASEEEYLIALEAEERMGASNDPDARERSSALREGAEKRLALFDVPREEIARLKRTRRANRTVTLKSPVTGYVLEIMARRGMEVSPEMVLYKVANLSSVWVTADVYEDEMANVQAGMPAVMRFRQLPGREFTGRVEYVYPFLDAEARTNKVRIALANPALDLRPGMYGEVILEMPGVAELTVPIDAVIRTGTRDIVYVEISPGQFAGREIELGPRRADEYVVRSGLSAGDTIVERGGFFLDSEAALRAPHAGH